MTKPIHFRRSTNTAAIQMNDKINFVISVVLGLLALVASILFIIEVLHVPGL